LRVPEGPGPHPLMILIHGGCWLSAYDITHIGKLANAFAQNGVATWAGFCRK
jgi:acetyl esterase/lipase